ncbi:hypothetical protein GOV11_02645 [Candidatus Woesearchaeota archaeon]|nr:hypothetical protein [Candidatus Woesearchaeota archaeon]
MREAVKMVFIPLTGVIAIALVFMLVIWGANWYDDVVNDKDSEDANDAKLIGYAVMGPGTECDDSYFPVCGLDGETYDNNCKAVNAGTEVSYRGVCQE